MSQTAEAEYRVNRTLRRHAFNGHLFYVILDVSSTTRFVAQSKSFARSMS